MFFYDIKIEEHATSTTGRTCRVFLILCLGHQFSLCDIVYPIYKRTHIHINIQGKLSDSCERYICNHYEHRSLGSPAFPIGKTK